jgi:hypothetical protein
MKTRAEVRRFAAQLILDSQRGGRGTVRRSCLACQTTLARERVVCAGCEALLWQVVDGSDQLTDVPILEGERAMTTKERIENVQHIADEAARELRYYEPWLRGDDAALADKLHAAIEATTAISVHILARQQEAARRH